MTTDSGSSGPRQDLAAITVFTTVDGRAANKLIMRKPGGGITKRRAESAKFTARTVPCPDLAALRDVVQDVTARHDQMISLSLFAGVPEGVDEWEVWPCWMLAKRLDCDADDRERLKGFHEIDGKWVAARIKESMTHGSYVLFDRDMVAEMPTLLEGLSFEDWRRAVALLFPGADTCGMVVVPSTTSRVVLDGVRLSSASCHAIVKVDDPDDLERAWAVATRRSLVTAFAAVPWDDETTLAFRKGVYARKTGTGALLRWSWWTIYDRSTWAVAREVFDGKPTALEPGIAVLDATVELIDGPDLAMSAVRDPTMEEEAAMHAAEEALVGVKVTCTRTHRLKGNKRRFNGWKIVVDDLTEDVELDLGDRWTTVAELQAAKSGKVRCQTPFRDSESMAAFYNTFGDGSPYVFDSGTNEMHVLEREGRPLTITLCERWLLEDRRVAFAYDDGRFHFADIDKPRRLEQVGADDALLAMVKLAPDAPRLKDGTTTDWNRLPQHIGRWMKSAWENLLQVLPGQRAAAAIPVTAPDTQRDLLTILRTIHSGTNFRCSSGEHTLAEWARLDAEQLASITDKAHWGQVGNFELYSRHGEPYPDIAIRPEIAGQLRWQIPSIARLSIEEFAKRVGESGFGTGEVSRIRFLQDAGATLAKGPRTKRIRVVQLNRALMEEPFGTDDPQDVGQVVCPKNSPRKEPGAPQAESENGGLLPFPRRAR